MIEGFHLLRPWWLVGLAPAAFAVWMTLRFQAREDSWQEAVSEPLRPFVISGGGESRKNQLPVIAMGVAWLFSVIALAGPSWEKAELPGARDESILVILMDLSRSMLATDIQPSRVERAKQKTDLLLDDRSGSKTAVVAFAGTAHLVIPPATDPNAVGQQVGALRTTIMPEQGTDLAAALTLADSVLTLAEAGGSVLIITDGVDGSNADIIARFDTFPGRDVIVWAVGTEAGGPIPLPRGGFLTDTDGSTVIVQLDVAALKSLDSGSAVKVVRMTIDDGDVDRVDELIDEQLTTRDDPEAEAKWIDRGYWFLLPVIVIMLFWFRKGWVVACFALLVTPILSGCALEEDRPINDIWFSRDQQAEILLERGDSTAAAARFEDTMWRGVVALRLGEFTTAAAAFEQSQSAAGYYNLGNTYVAQFDTIPDFRWRQQVSMLRKAVAAYDVALTLDSNLGRASANREIVSEQIEAIQRRFAAGGMTDVGADDEVEDEEDYGQGGEEAEDQGGEPSDEQGESREGTSSTPPSGMFGESPTLSDETARDLVSRLVNDDPSVFLRNKFAVQASRMPSPDTRPAEPW